MSDNGDLREDLKLPDGELGQQLKAENDQGKELMVGVEISLLIGRALLPLVLNVLFFLQCTVLKSCGEECVIAIKTNTTLDK